MHKLPSEEVQKLLKVIFDNCMQEDNAVRDTQIRKYRRLKLLWEGFSNVWYSETAHDWRIWNDTTDEGTDQAYYDKPVNVFKAYLESIIAALSVTVPAIKCYPDDADDTLDLSTAKAGDKIAQLIYRHNDVTLLWLHALFIFATEGMTACYSYPKEDYEFGSYTENEEAEFEDEVETTTCSSCGNEIDSRDVGPDEPPLTNTSAPGSINQSSQNPDGGIEDLKNQEIDEFAPDNEDSKLHYALTENMDLCPVCMQMMDPQITREKFITTRIVDSKTLPKSRICLEAYGGLYVKVAQFARNQKGTPYLIFGREDDYSLTVEKYKHLYGNTKLIKFVKDNVGENKAGGYTQYAQWGRINPQYIGAFPENVVTINTAWIRPGKFNVLSDEVDVKRLQKLYPDGVKVTFVNDEFAESCNEALDDCWTLLENPLSDYLSFEPSGQGLTSIQEITNDLISLVLQTIEHGIGQTFADPAVLNFNAYQQTEVLPGGIFPATAKSGKGMGDGFHELKTATLSSEVMPFQNYIQSMGQLTSGALPSLFGGALEGSETASQYSMSRAQALQRQQNTWKMFTKWWKTIFSKVVPMYIDNVKEDERDVKKNKDGSFINTFIRKAELEGKIGKVELEASENLPMTWGQRKDTIEKILTNTNPEIIQILGIQSPENLTVIHEALGLVDFFIPGEDDVIKQYDEIKLLLNSEPIPTGDPMMPEMASVQIDPDYDNHAVEFEIVRKWVISEAGRQAKMDNPPGYTNVLLHGKLHLMQIQQLAMQQQMQQQEQGAAPNGKKPDSTKVKEAPITGESDVQTT